MCSKFSDEGHVLLSGNVNSNNKNIWGTAPLEDVLQRPLHSTKCTARLDISEHGIIGPFWFDSANEQSVMVITERYLVVIRKFSVRWADAGASL